VNAMPEQWSKMKELIGCEIRERGLFTVTSFLVALTRRGAWESFGSLLVYWFLHALGLVMFLMLTDAVIFSLHKSILGYEHPLNTGDVIKERHFYILVTVALASIAAFMMEHGD
jgi:hypothetical protein